MKTLTITTVALTFAACTNVASANEVDSRDQLLSDLAGNIATEVSIMGAEVFQSSKQAASQTIQEWLSALDAQQTEEVQVATVTEVAADRSE